AIAQHQETGSRLIAAERLELPCEQSADRLVPFHDPANLVDDEDAAGNELDDRRQVFAQSEAATRPDDVRDVDGEGHDAVHAAIFAVEGLQDEIDEAPLDPFPTVPAPHDLVLDESL